MKKFLVSILCMCITFTMMPLLGGVDFSAAAAPLIPPANQYERDGEADPILGIKVEQDNASSTTNISLVNYKGDLCMVHLGGLVEGDVHQNVEIKVEGYNEIRFCSEDTAYNVTFTGSGTIEASGNISFLDVTVDGPTITYYGYGVGSTVASAPDYYKYGNVSATNFTMKSGEFYARRMHVATFTQLGGVVGICSPDGSFNHYDGSTYTNFHSNNSLYVENDLKLSGGYLDVANNFYSENKDLYEWDTLPTGLSQVNEYNSAVVASDMIVTGGVISVAQKGYTKYYTSYTNYYSGGYNNKENYASSCNKENPAIYVKDDLYVTDGIVIADCQSVDAYDSIAIYAEDCNTDVNATGCMRWIRGTDDHEGKCLQLVNMDDVNEGNFVYITESLITREDIAWKSFDSDYVKNHTVNELSYSPETTFKNALYSEKGFEINGQYVASNTTLLTESYATVTNIAADTTVIASGTSLLGSFDGELYTGELLIASDTTIDINAIVKATGVTVASGVTLTINGEFSANGKVTLKQGARIINNGYMTVHVANDCAFYLDTDAYISGTYGLISVASKHITKFSGEAARIYGLADVDKDLITPYGYELNWNPNDYRELHRDVTLGVANAKDYKWDNTKLDYYKYGVATIVTGIYPIWVAGERILVSGTNADGKSLNGTWKRNENFGKEVVDASSTNASGTDASPTDVSPTDTIGGPIDPYKYYEEFKYVGNNPGIAGGELYFYPQTATLPAKLVLKNVRITGVNQVGPEIDGLKFNHSMENRHNLMPFNMVDYDDSAVAAIYANNPIDIQYSGNKCGDLDTGIDLGNDIGNYYTYNGFSLVTAGIYSPFSVALYADQAATGTNYFKIDGLKNGLDFRFDDQLYLAAGIYGYDVSIGQAINTSAYTTPERYALNNRVDINSPDLDREGIHNYSNAITAGIYSKDDTFFANDLVNILAGNASNKGTYAYGVYAGMDLEIGFSDKVTINATAPNEGAAIAVKLDDDLLVESVNELDIDGANIAVLADEDVEMSCVKYANITGLNGIKAAEDVEIEDSNVDIEAYSTTGIGVEAERFEVSQATDTNEVNILSGLENKKQGYIGIKAEDIELEGYAVVYVDTYGRNISPQNPTEESQYSYAIILEKQGDGEYGIVTNDNSILYINNRLWGDDKSDFGIYDCTLATETGYSVVCAKDNSKINVEAKNVGILANVVNAYGSSTSWVNTTSDGNNMDINGELPLSFLGGIIADYVNVEAEASVIALSNTYGILSEDIDLEDNGTILALSAEDAISTDELTIEDTATVLAESTKAIAVNVDKLNLLGGYISESNDMEDFVGFAKIHAYGKTYGIKTTALDIERGRHFTMVRADGGEYGIYVASDSNIDDGLVYANGGIGAITSDASNTSIDLGTGYKVLKAFTTETSFEDTKKKVGSGTNYQTVGLFDHEYASAGNFGSVNTIYLYFPMVVSAKVTGVGECSFSPMAQDNMVNLPYNDEKDDVYLTAEVLNFLNAEERFEDSYNPSNFDWFNSNVKKSLQGYKVEIQKDSNGTNLRGNIVASITDLTYKDTMNISKSHGVTLNYRRGDHMVITETIAIEWGNRYNYASYCNANYGLSVATATDTNHTESNPYYIVTLDNVTIDVAHLETYNYYETPCAALTLPKGADVQLVLKGNNYIIAPNDSYDLPFAISNHMMHDNGIAYEPSIITITGQKNATLKLVGKENTVSLTKDSKIIYPNDINGYSSVCSTGTDYTISTQKNSSYNSLTHSLSTYTDMYMSNRTIGMVVNPIGGEKTAVKTLILALNKDYVAPEPPVTPPTPPVNPPQTGGFGGGAITPSTFKVTFDMNGHGTAPAQQTVKSGDKAVEPKSPTAEGFVFGGWYADKECKTTFDFTKNITANTTVYAKWTEKKEEPKFDVQKAVDNLKLKVTTVYTKRNNTQVKVSVVSGKDALTQIKDNGYTVKYKFCRSTKRSSGYKNMFTTKKDVYTNTKGELGKKYYYKAVLLVLDKNGKTVATTELSDCAYGCRVFKGEVEA